MGSDYFTDLSDDWSLSLDLLFSEKIAKSVILVSSVSRNIMADLLVLPNNSGSGFHFMVNHFGRTW
jgi:hypothetical protein